MPRKHANQKHAPYKYNGLSQNKIRYSSKTAAEQAAAKQMLFSFHLELSVYQDIDGGWYVTSKTNQNQHK